MKKKTIMAMALSVAVCLSTLTVGITAEESTLILPTSLWTATTQNANSVSINQMDDGIQFGIKSFGAGENNYVDWAGDADGAGPGYVDFSKPVDFCFTIDSLDMGTDTYASFTNIWTYMIILGASKAVVLNLASTSTSATDPGITLYCAPGYINTGFTQVPVTFAGTTYFWHIDLKNHLIEIGTSSSPDVAPTTMTNIFTANFDQLPTNDDDFMGSFAGRPNIGGTIEMKYTMHEFQGTSMIPASVTAIEGEGATVVDSQITYDVNNSNLTVANLLAALEIEGGISKVYDGATLVGNSTALKSGLTIEVKNGAIVNLYTVTLANAPVVATPTPVPTTVVTQAPTQAPTTNPVTADAGANAAIILLVLAAATSILVFNKKVLLSK